MHIYLYLEKTSKNMDVLEKAGLLEECATEKCESGNELHFYPYERDFAKDISTIIKATAIFIALDGGVYGEVPHMGEIDRKIRKEDIDFFISSVKFAAP